MPVFKLLNIPMLGASITHLMPWLNVNGQQSDTTSEIISAMSRKGQVEKIEQTSDEPLCRALLSVHDTAPDGVATFRAQLTDGAAASGRKTFLVCVATEKDGSQNFEYFPYPDSDLHADDGTF